jgi:presenilin-like A22 family membrane protease
MKDVGKRKDRVKYAQISITKKNSLWSCDLFLVVLFCIKIVYKCSRWWCCHLITFCILESFSNLFQMSFLFLSLYLFVMLHFLFLIVFQFISFYSSKTWFKMSPLCSF